MVESADMAHKPRPETAAAGTAAAPQASSTAFQPYVPATQSPAEFTIKAIVIGAMFGLIFGASTVYLGLRAGLTVSASIPIAVLAIAVLKRLGGSTILENNIVQTIGSAGESLASGVVFTLPALIFLTPYGPAYFNYLQITMLALAGGLLGVLMMVPLRRALIVKEHGVLPFPEGTACGDVLVAGERGGQLARTVFLGLGFGAAWKAMSWIFQVTRTAVGYSVPKTGVFPNATFNLDLSPEYMGVGYVIGPRIAGVMFAGGVLSWMVLLPLLSIAGRYMDVPFPPVPASGLKLSEMNPNQMWSAYIRYIGAGAVLASGLITLARTLPRILSSFREGVKDFGRGGTASVLRTDRDLPLSLVLGRHGTCSRCSSWSRRNCPRREFSRGDPDDRVRLLLRDRVGAHHRSDRQFFQPDLRHDDRHVDPHLHDLRRARPGRRRLRADRTHRRRRRLHRGGDCRRHVAGLENRDISSARRRRISRSG